MKLIQTLNQAQILNLINGNIEGIFKDLFEQDSPLYNHALALAQQYYLSNSSDKLVTPFYLRLLDYQKQNADIDPVVVVVNSLKSRYVSKWENIYKALFLQTYSMLDDYTKTETKTGTNQDKTTYDTTSTKQASDTDTTTFDITTKNDGTKKSVEDKTSENTTNSDLYGFATTSPVGDTVDTTQDLSKTNVDNTTSHTNKKTGTESKTYGVDETNTNTGTDTKDYTINETTTINGRNVSASEILQKEIDYRIMNDVQAIIFQDIDSIMCLQIYKRD